MNETNITTEQNLLVMDFNLLASWDDFEHIIMVLQKYFDATLAKRVDGAESKFVTLIIETGELTLINNPYGNTLKASSLDAKASLMEVYNNWNKYSKL